MLKKRTLIKAEKDNQNDMVNSPNHYTVGLIEAIDVMKAKLTREQFIGHLLATSLKYLMRFNYKDKKLLDTEKAGWYVNRLILELRAEEDEE